MLSKISSKFHGWAKGWWVIVFVILDGFFVVTMSFIGALMKSGTGLEQPLDLMILATPDKLFAMLERYGDSTRMFYRGVELTVDIVYPIVYMLAFGLLISWLFQRGFASTSKMQKLNVLPVGAWFFDLLENISIVILISAYPAQPVAIAWLTFTFTSIKWLFAGASILMIVFGLVKALLNGFKKQM